MRFDVKKLNHDEELSLARRARRGDERARDLLVQSNLPLVIHVARQVKGPLPLEDKIQEGVTGLIRAVERFDPKKGLRFSTYAFRLVWQAISRAIADQSRTIRVPAQMQLRLHRFEQGAEQLGVELGRNPTSAELSSATGLSRGRIRQFREYSRWALSLDAITADADGARPCDGDDRDDWCPEHAAVARTLRREVFRSLRLLDARERSMLSRRFGLLSGRPESLSEIGRHYALSRERVRQIVEGALEKIRSSPAKDSLAAYL